MSENADHVEMLRAAYETFNTHKRFDAALLTNDVEFTQPEGADGEGVYHGPDGVARGVLIR
jgi:hypothetical protein